MRYLLKQFGWIIIVMFLMACEQKQANMEIRTGDILFRGSLNSELSKAINSVTQTHKATQYTHMGIVEVLDSMVWVYHAAPLREFAGNYWLSLSILMRLIQQWLVCIDYAILFKNIFLTP